MPRNKQPDNDSYIQSNHLKKKQGVRIGIFSGTFDPIHTGHLLFAHEAQEYCQLDKVFFLIEPRPRKKQGVKALEHRSAMVQLAIAKEKSFSTIVLEQTQFNVSETLPILQSLFQGSELFMLIGDDVISHLVDWPHVRQLAKSVQFIIGVRHKSVEELKRHIEVIQLTKGLPLNYSIFQAQASDVSSSKIRAQLRNGKTPTALSPAVYAYIIREKLYKSGDHA
ncbi:MAG: nicotinate-nucleotide adenylyltransferase [Candidatus Saccharimonadales bacterium]